MIKLFEKPETLKGYSEYYNCFYNENIEKIFSSNLRKAVFSTDFTTDIYNEGLISTIRSQLRKEEQNNFADALKIEVEIQRGLIYKFISATTDMKLGLLRMDILTPIVCWESDSCDYIFPVLLLFKDGRIILKYSFNIVLIEKNELINMSEKYSITKMVNSYDYFQFENGEIRKRTPKIGFKEISDIITIDFEKKNKEYNSIKSLYVHYETLTITEINKELSYDKYKDFFLHVTHAPVDTIISAEYTQCGIELGYGEFLVTPKKSVIYSKADFIKKIMNDSRVNSNEILLANLGGFYPALLKTLLKKYRLMYLNQITFQEEIIEKKNFELYKKEYLFNIYETDIIYSYYDSVIKLTDQVDALIIPPRTVKLIEDLSDSRTKFEQYVLDSKREKTEFFFTMIAFILTLVLSFEAIESMMVFFGFWKYSFIVYLLFNSIIFIGYFIYKWKLKRK